MTPAQRRATIARLLKFIKRPTRRAKDGRYYATCVALLANAERICRLGKRKHAKAKRGSFKF